MAVVQVRSDDLDNTPDAEEVTFAYGGKQYSIDLSKKNQDRLEAALKPFIDKARPVGTKGPAKRGGQPQLPPDERRAIMAWAKSKGKPVATKGRISQTIIDEYRQSKNAKPEGKAS